MGSEDMMRTSPPAHLRDAREIWTNNSKGAENREQGYKI